MSTPSTRLVDRLRREFPATLQLPRVTEVRRIYTSPAQRAAGAWSWELWGGPDITDLGPLDIGSQFPVKECLAAPRLTADYSRHSQATHIDPEPA